MKINKLSDMFANYVINVKLSFKFKFSSIKHTKCFSFSLLLSDLYSCVLVMTIVS